MNSFNLSAPRPITEGLSFNLFDCGVISLNHWLQKCAIKNSCSSDLHTYVIVNSDHEVIGYYCLTIGAVGHTTSKKLLSKSITAPITVMVLNRLAIHKDYHNQGLGKALLREAVLRSFQASEIAGVSALLAHTLSEAAKRFYLSNGFRQSPISPEVLYL